MWYLLTRVHSLRHPNVFNHLGLAVVVKEASHDKLHDLVLPCRNSKIYQVLAVPSMGTHRIGSRHWNIKSGSVSPAQLTFTISLFSFLIEQALGLIISELFSDGTYAIRQVLFKILASKKILPSNRWFAYKGILLQL